MASVPQSESPLPPPPARTAPHSSAAIAPRMLPAVSTEEVAGMQPYAAGRARIQSVESLTRARGSTYSPRVLARGAPQPLAQRS